MIEMTFELDPQKIAESRFTQAQVEAIIRKLFKKWNGVEVAPLTFQRDDEYALGAFGNFFQLWMDDPEFLSCFAACYWYVDGQREDCLNEFLWVQENIVM
jgi:hypothetical protein